MKRQYKFLHAGVVLALILCVPSAFPQLAGYKDRLARVRDLVNSNELI